MTTAISSRESLSTRGASKFSQWLAMWSARQRWAAEELFPRPIDALTGRPLSRPFPTQYY